MKGVILAAGDGGRLRPFTYRTPKPLIRLRDRPLISYPLVAMAEAGIREVGIVVGYQADQIVKGLAEWAPDGVRLEFIHNPEFEGGNAVSVRAARDFAGDGPFMLAMSDHIIEPDVAVRLVEGCERPALLGVDSAACMESQLSDATKVLVDGNGCLRRIGKGLRQWNAVDIGVFVFQSSVFDDLDDLYEREGAALELSRVMQHLANKPCGVSTRDIEGLFWTDIDTLADFKCAYDHLGSATDLPL
ncbi:MAG: sugar phosphate nucleotidyltransferase [Chloroflexi bacterium]|nr:sugar phosphate nucleotidyltransferase [Chloroflexota bacterium]